MASFTDQISQFNPYIQQLPVEAMTQVGMFKQQKYDEGVQKIQGYIDNVAGLDVIRDIDKGYLQSKLDQLGNRLKTVAAGDFSNFQLVNSVGGMATQIVKDPNVQNAVISTSKYRKEVERMQKEIDEGKSAPENIRKFNKTADSWLSSNELGQRFTGSYIKHFDVNKFAKETFDAVKPDGYTFEEVYVTDSAGNIVKDPKTGKPVFSPIMTRLEKEGIFPNKVKETLDQIFSDPRVTQQLQITGEYNYEGYSGDLLKSKVNDIRDKRLGTFDVQLADLNLKKAAGQDVQAQIDLIEGKKKEITASYEKFLTMADENPDAVRGMIYKDDVYDNYTTMYGSMKEKRTTHENPGWNAMFKIQQEQNEQRRHAADLGYKYDALRQSDRHHVDNIKMAMLEFNAKYSPTAGGPKPRMVDMTSDISFNNLEEDTYNNAATTAQDAVYDFVVESGVLGNAVNETINNFDGKISSKDAVRKIAEQNSKSLGMTPEQYTRWLYDKANTFMANSGNSNLTPRQRIVKNSAENALVNFKNIQTIRTKIDGEAGPAAILEATKNLKTEAIRIGSRNIELTPQDQYDVALAYAGSDWYESSEVKAAAKASQKRLESRGIDKDAVQQIIQVVQRSKPMGRSNIATAISNLLSVVDRKDNVTSLQRRSAEVQKYYQISPELEETVLKGDEKTIKAKMDEALGLIGTYQRFGGQESSEFMKNYPKMAAIASGKDKGTFTMKASRNDVTGQITPKLMFTSEDGSFAGEMTITPDEAMKFGQDVSRWWQPRSYAMAEQILSATGNGTTSFSGLVDDQDTYINNDVLYNKTPDIFPQLMGMPDDIKANISKTTMTDANGTMRDVYIGHVSVIDGDGNKYGVRQLPPAYSVAEVMQKFQGLTPQMINKLKEESKKRK